MTDIEIKNHIKDVPNQLAERVSELAHKGADEYIKNNRHGWIEIAMREYLQSGPPLPPKTEKQIVEPSQVLAEVMAIGERLEAMRKEFGGRLDALQAEIRANNTDDEGEVMAMVKRLCDPNIDFD
jgi:hypothetical protein